MIEFSAPTILFDPNTTSDAFQQKVCETVTHELSHQVWGELWFDTAFQLSLVNSNSRHYSCPRSVCCRSILFLGTVHTYPDIFESAKFFFADLGCVACVSGNFRSKERPRSGIFGFGCARNETRAKKWKRGWGGKGRKLLPHPLPPSAIFRAVFGSRSSFFSPKPHGNAHYAGYCGFGFRPNKCYFCDSGYRPIHLHFVPTVTKRISQPRFKAVWHAGRRYSISCLGRWKGKIQYRSFPFLSCRIVTHNKCHSSLI